MNCIVVQADAGDHLGFILCSIPDGSDAGDCVFMVLPKRPGLLESDAAKLLLRRRDAGESRIKVVRENPPSVRIQTPGIDAELFAEWDGGEAGVWGEVVGAVPQAVGRALIPAKT